MNGIYRRLPSRNSLCVTSLEECATRMAPCRAYTLRVGKGLIPFAYMLLKQMGATTRDHPFAPYINVVEVPALGPVEWFIEGDTGEAWGSEGV